MIFASPLKPIKLESPRDTMKSFINAMNDYRKGVVEKNAALKSRIDDAVRCLDLSLLSPLTKKEESIKSAIYLKEVIDRIIVIDFMKNS